MAAGKPDMRTRFEELRGIFCRSDASPPPDATKLRTRWIGELKAVARSRLPRDAGARFNHSG